uniref:Uncharacterized protein n=1 Tax=Vitis vinifera TaxID=29760 RepID=F6HG09_VITVI
MPLVISEGLGRGGRQRRKRVYRVLKEMGLAVEWKVEMWGVVTNMMMGMMECES